MFRKGKGELVSATDVQREFHGRAPWGVRFICPLCRQPLFPAAMTFKGKQNPHFRHEKNNERAHECELYASSYGYFSTYQRAPMPMFIRRSHARKEKFIVEGGFRKLDPTVFSELEREGAKVVIGQKSYNVTSQRFGAGLTKLPFEELTLGCGSIVSLSGSRHDLNSTWGYPEDANRAMVFTRDSDTAQGKRLNAGDTISFETDLFLLLRDGDSGCIHSAFSGARKAGTAGRSSALWGLSVYEVRLTKDDARWRLAKAYLEDCGFDVADSDSTPKIIWPPALTAGGGLFPLVENSKCIFQADARSAEDGKLYIHTSADTVNRVRTVPLRRGDNGSCGYAAFGNNSQFSFVTLRNRAFSSAVLLHPGDLNVDKLLHEIDSEPRLSLDDGLWTLEVSIPSRVLLYERSGTVSRLELSGDSNSLRFEDGSLDRIRVQQKLFASLDRVVVFEKCFERTQAGEVAPAESDAKAALIRLDAPNDIAFAISRGKGNRGSLHSIDRKRALLRKAGTQA